MIKENPKFKYYKIQSKSQSQNPKFGNIGILDLLGIWYILVVFGFQKIINIQKKSRSK
jgi:hypothetical protein